MPKTLSELLYGVALRETAGSMSRPVMRISADSRQEGPGGLFVAIAGTRSDGHQFIPQAIAGGADVIVCERIPEKHQHNITYVVVEDSREALGLIAASFYDHPSHKLKLIGVTGTNGKTSVVTLLYRLFRGLGYPCGLLSTVENRIDEKLVPATHTTPDPVALQALLARMVEQGCSHAFMEVSSHAIDQRRIAGCEFALAVFTNISHDHLDYHGDMKTYIQAKKRFFDNLPLTAQALINADDKRGAVMVQNTRARVRSYSLRGAGDYNARILESGFSGLHLLVDGSELHSLLIGEFNAYNVLSVYASALLMGEKRDEVLREISRLRSAEGRFDYLISPVDRLVGIIDYAHTPDALEKVLTTIRSICSGNEKLISIVGCGGDRDRSKRPLMAKIAAQLSDLLILSSDNPRTEEPQAILDEMMQGVELPYQARTLSQVDRREAIRTAVMMAAPGDIILVAGKGHEKYQEIMGVRHPFDDRAILLECFQTQKR